MIILDVFIYILSTKQSKFQSCYNYSNKEGFPIHLTTKYSMFKAKQFKNCLQRGPDISCFSVSTGPNCIDVFYFKNSIDSIDRLGLVVRTRQIDGRRLVIKMVLFYLSSAMAIL